VSSQLFLPLLLTVGLLDFHTIISTLVKMELNGYWQTVFRCALFSTAVTDGIEHGLENAFVFAVDS